MLTLWGFFCMGCLIIAAIRAVKDMLSPKRRQQRKEIERLHKETNKLLGRE